MKTTPQFTFGASNIATVNDSIVSGNIFSSIQTNQSATNLSDSVPSPSILSSCKLNICKPTHLFISIEQSSEPVPTGTISEKGLRSPSNIHDDSDKNHSLSNSKSNRSHSQLVKKRRHKRNIKSIVCDIFEDASPEEVRNITKSLSKKTEKCARKFVASYCNDNDAYDYSENDEFESQVTAQSKIARQQMSNMMDISYMRQQQFKQQMMFQANLMKQIQAKQSTKQSHKPRRNKKSKE